MRAHRVQEQRVAGGGSHTLRVVGQRCDEGGDERVERGAEGGEAVRVLALVPEEHQKRDLNKQGQLLVNVLQEKKKKIDWKKKIMMMKRMKKRMLKKNKN